MPISILKQPLPSGRVKQQERAPKSFYCTSSEYEKGLADFHRLGLIYPIENLFMGHSHVGLAALYCRAGQGLEGTNLSTQHCMEKPLELQVLSSIVDLFEHDWRGPPGKQFTEFHPVSNQDKKCLQRWNSCRIIVKKIEVLNLDWYIVEQLKKKLK